MMVSNGMSSLIWYKDGLYLILGVLGHRWLIVCLMAFLFASAIRDEEIIFVWQKMFFLIFLTDSKYAD